MKRNSLRQAICGWEQNKQITSQNAGKQRFWAILYKTKAQEHREKKNLNHQKQKNNKKHRFAFWQATPYFC